MDVLKEIQQAEAKAREIEREYDEKAKSLAAGDRRRSSRGCAPSAKPRSSASSPR